MDFLKVKIGFVFVSSYKLELLLLLLLFLLEAHFLEYLGNVLFIWTLWVFFKIS
jgi:hypothetical protein